MWQLWRPHHTNIPASQHNRLTPQSDPCDNEARPVSKAHEGQRVRHAAMDDMVGGDVLLRLALVWHVPGRAIHQQPGLTAASRLHNATIYQITTRCVSSRRNGARA